ncbi:hypothetical protein D3C75_1256650 [compost metagenome]
MPGGQLADQRGAGDVLGGGAMGKIHPDHIDPGADQALDGLRRGGSRAQGGDYLRSAQHGFSQKVARTAGGAAARPVLSPRAIA